MSYPTLEFNWVRNVDKSLVVPAIVFTNLTEYGGCYYHPFESELLLEGRYYDRRNGLIEISADNPELHAGIIAHEWRHHWQFYKGWEYDGDGWQCNEPGDYDEMIRSYFRSSICEADALRFQLRYAPDDVSDHWLGLLNG